METSSLIRVAAAAALLLQPLSAQNAALTRSTTTGQVNGNVIVGGSNFLRAVTTPVELNVTAPLTWASVTAQVSIQPTSSRHGLIVYAPTGTANAIVGWSSSGAVAGKFYQDTSYTAPAVYVGRAATSATIPTFEIGAFTGDNNHTALAINPPNASISPFKVTYGGAITGSSLNLSTGGVSAGGGTFTGPVTALSILTNGAISAAGTISGSNFPSTARIEIGSGAPSSTPANGTIYINTAGNATTTLYIRAAGAWVAK